MGHYDSYYEDAAEQSRKYTQERLANEFVIKRDRIYENTKYSVSEQATLVLILRAQYDNLLK